MRSGSIGFVGVAAVSASLFAAGGPAPAVPQRAADQAPPFRSGVEVVTVDAGVVDKQGQPLRGLTAADFAVTVDGKPRRVVTAEFVGRDLARAAAGAEAEAGAVSTNEGAAAGRLVAFIVDQSTLDASSTQRVAAAAGPFLSRLAFADRSALVVLPAGPRVEFTWAHERVQSALRRVAGTGRPVSGWEAGSLAEARDIANHDAFALRTVGERVCGSSAALAGGGAAPAAGLPAGRGGAAPAGGDAGGTPGTAPAAPGAGGRASGAPAGGGMGRFGASGCLRDLQMQADMAWTMAKTTTLASLSALRVALGELAQVPGDKTAVLISGGWPMDLHDETSSLLLVAAEAAAARVTLFTIFVPASPVSVDRRMVSAAPVADSYLSWTPLDNLAAMTGGGSYRAEVGAEAAFDQISRELAAYYRLGIERDPAADRTDRTQRLKVQVLRSGARVRARETFDIRTYADRDWAARLDSAVTGPTVATGLGLRVTSFLALDPEDRSRLRLLVAGEASRAQPGEATLKVLVSNLEGKKIATGHAPVELSGGEASAFSANIAVPRGPYVLRVGLMDSAGRVGSADHRVDARAVALGSISATGPVLIRVPYDGAGEPRFAVDRVGREERLALEVGLEGGPGRLADAGVEFEIASADGGPALLRVPAALSDGSREGSMVAQGFANMRVLPPGSYVARVRVSSGSDPLGDLRRGFDVVGSGREAGGAEKGPQPADRSGARAGPAARVPLTGAAPFAIDQVLSPPVLDTFLDRVAARPDAGSAAVRDLLDRARAGGPGVIAVPDALAAETPSAAFLKGLALLSQQKLEPAALAFRDAMRAAADFSPAMVYLGACYAAGGNDKQAAAVWRTALIREGDTASLHALLADALLRQGRADAALDDLDAARTRWPQDHGLNRRFAMAALLGGRQLDGLRALDTLIAERADDEPSLSLALFMLYLAFDTGTPIESASQDRERMRRLADRYRSVGGPSVALVDTWVAAAAGRQ
jgi:VWFA-related protein